MGFMQADNANAKPVTRLRWEKGLPSFSTLESLRKNRRHESMFSFYTVRVDSDSLWVCDFARFCWVGCAALFDTERKAREVATDRKQGGRTIGARWLSPDRIRSSL